MEAVEVGHLTGYELVLERDIAVVVVMVGIALAVLGGAGRFLKDRLVRLGIPLALYSWVINPVFVYLVQYDSIDKPFWRFFPVEYFKGGLIGQGPLWFIEVLLIFSLSYVLYRLIVRSRPASAAKETRFPSNRTIVIFALLLGLAGFLVRGQFVMDEYNFQALNLQIPFFAQYIALFVVGLIAFRRNWLAELPDKTGRLWLRMALLMVILWAAGERITYIFDPAREPEKPPLE